MTAKQMENMWTTREGQRIPIREMTDSHLRNTIAYLRRNVDGLKEIIITKAGEETWSPSMPHESAAEAAGLVYEIGDMETEDFLATFIPSYRALLREQARREGKSRRNRDGQAP